MNDQAQTVAEFDHVAVRYGRTNVLDDVSFTVPKGSVLAILGRNGAGKSSLLRCLLGLQSPQRGTVRLLDQEDGRGHVQSMKRIGVVPEEPDAPTHLTTPQLVRLVGSFHESWDHGGVNAQLSRMKIPASVPFGSLSKGQKTVTMLALALGHQPELLILDDPTLGLDAVAKKAVIDELIATLAARGITVIIATHELGIVERFAEHVVVLGQHRVLLNEATESLKHRFRRIRGGADAAFTGFQIQSQTDQPWGREVVVSDFSDQSFDALRATHPDTEATALSLEEIFLTTVGNEAT